MSKGIKDVFQCWYDDDDDQKQRAMEIDAKLTEDFAMQHLTKDIDNFNKTSTFLSSNYNKLKVFYR